MMGMMVMTNDDSVLMLAMITTMILMMMIEGMKRLVMINYDDVDDDNGR